MGSRSARGVLGLVSVLAIVGLYTLVAGTYGRPDILPPTRALLDTAASLVAAPAPESGGGGHAHVQGHPPGPVEAQPRLPAALLVSSARVVAGVLAGSALGIGLGLLMGWNRRVDDYVHPVYVLLRSIPPLALITYVMLWLGHGEAHLLVPVAYAVFATMVVPTYHAVRDLAAVHVAAARALGAGRWLLLRRVVLPAASPRVLAGLRYALVVAWMTTVGAEMLMADRGIGHLIVGGGLWASRGRIGVDPAAVMVAIVGLATVGYAMDAGTRLMTARLTAWTTARP